MKKNYEGTWITASDACTILGCSAPSFYRWRKKHEDFPTHNQLKLYLDLDILAYAGRHAIRTAKIVKG